MSIKISTLVWAHYHSCPSEKLTALAYADHAQDDGTRVRPSVAYIARKTGQSERTVQRYLAHMRATGWLLTVRYGDGGRNKATEYRINPEWLRNPGQLITSARNASERSVNLIEKGDTGGLKRVTSGVRKGDSQSTERASAVSPQSSLNPLEPTTTREMPGKSILESTNNFLWPAIFSEHLQASARQLLRDCASDKGQLMLDEIAGIATRMIVRHPIALLRKLVEREAMDAFVPDAALRVRHDRELHRRAAEQRSLESLKITEAQQRRQNGSTEGSDCLNALKQMLKQSNHSEKIRSEPTCK